MLQSDAVIWFQRYQSSDLKRGSISLARQIDACAESLLKKMGALTTYSISTRVRVQRENALQ
jgi:hypothetical protein